MGPLAMASQVQSEYKTPEGNLSCIFFLTSLTHPTIAIALMRLFRDSRQPARNLVHPSEEDVLMQLVHYDVVILMDDSWSMNGKRWEQVRNCVSFHYRGS